MESNLSCGFLPLYCIVFPSAAGDVKSSQVIFAL